jgi:hypothetical protein
MYDNMKYADLHINMRVLFCHDGRVRVGRIIKIIPSKTVVITTKKGGEYNRWIKDIRKYVRSPKKKPISKP